MKMCGIAAFAPSALAGTGVLEGKLYAADLQRIMAKIKAEPIRTVTCEAILADDNRIEWLYFAVFK